MDKKLKVGVVYGGISSEREVSINTGKQIIENLNRDKYEVYDILLNSKRDILKCDGLDFVFIALHGEFGEDGTVQSVLETLDIKYNGCNSLTSGICMNKSIVKDILRNYNVKMAEGEIFKKHNYDLENFKLKFPVIVKPNSGGSSVGMGICNNKEELESFLQDVFKYDDVVLVEEFIKGREVTCGILNGEALPILEIITQNREFFNYESKYDDTTKEDPADLPSYLDEEIKNISKKCYEILGCKVYGRVDFIIKDDEAYFLEINTLPGMTKGSLFPKMARSIGIEFSSLLDLLIESSLKG